MSLNVTVKYVVFGRLLKPSDIKEFRFVQGEGGAFFLLPEFDSCRIRMETEIFVGGLGFQLL